MESNWINRPADENGPAYSFATIDRGAPWDAGVRLRHTVEVSGEADGQPATWSADVETTHTAEPGDIASVDGRLIISRTGTRATLAEAKLAALIFVESTDIHSVEYDPTPPARSTYASRMS